MIIVHSAQLDDGLFLWVEAPVRGEATDKASKKPKARRAGAPPPPYPYLADFDDLSRVIRNLPVGFRPTRRRVKAVNAWLPTRGALPFASTPLVGDVPGGRGKPKLLPWRVEGLLLDPIETFGLLSIFGERGRAVPGLLNGRDFSFWLEALRFAGSLVTRQRYLPDLEKRASQWHAAWRPVWFGEDEAQRETLAERMPAAARALAPEADSDAPQVTASRRLESFVAGMLDQIVRRQGGLPTAVAVTADKPGDKGDAPPREIPPHERWFRSLRTDKSRVPPPVKGLAALSREVGHWREPMDQAAAAPFRLCFRLEEPKDTTREDKPPPKKNRRKGRNGRGGNKDAPLSSRRRWFVRYLLQGRDDPNLVVPTADAWVTRGRKAAALTRMGADLHATLLAFLGQAAGLCPRIGETLHSRKPSGFSLDARGAHEFLTVTAPELEQAGFGTLSPQWWTNTGTAQRLSVRARVETPPLAEAGPISLDDDLRYEWEICIGGHPLSKPDLDKLAKSKEPLQRMHGHWVSTGPEEIDAAFGFWKKREAGRITARELVRLALGSADMSAGIRFDGVKASGWMEGLLASLQDKSVFGEVEAPEVFVGQLRPYQERGYDWLDFLSAWGFGACLADDMGLGKTIQTLALLQLAKDRGEERPALIVCPTSVLSNWEHEAARFTPELSCYLHHGPSRARGGELTVQAHAHNIVLTSYALLQRDVEDLSTLPWAGLILDEAQNIKNPDTLQSRAVRTLFADYRIALTGTPVENHVGDLWSIMDFLNPGFLGSKQAFKKSFLVPIQQQGDREAAERLKKMTAPFVLRRLKTDRSIISDLPEKLEMKVYCALTGEQGKHYEAIVEEADSKIQSAKGIKRRGVILAALTKLKQVCNHPAHLLGDGSKLDGRSGKLTRLGEMLEEILANGECSVIFTQFAKMGALLQQHLSERLGCDVIFLHGGTPKRRRDAMVEHFQSGRPDAPPIFVLSLKAGGTGLNLTAATHVFHFDRWWNPAVEDQATDRAFRIGQTKNVQVHKFVCAGTLEERIDAMIERKRAIADDIVGSGENWITQFSNDEIHQLLALEKGAVRD